MYDRRVHLRVPTNLDVQYEVPGGAVHDAVLTDLGLGGTRLSAVRPPPQGSTVTVVARLPGATHRSRIPATVRWTASDCFGVRFGLVAARDTHLIAEVMRCGLSSNRFE